ncbi:DUF2922 domain-containing protein [Romboutsia weinsteinii]|uniref:DUF2922 domain-containing protein n=1 Tax=Romboutsia weinsteinii TaxID=2020949 RepID=A0A371J3R3_9FIRM|nr:DUF2922 domain-containing protein [Romboutsia weinsteinii]RDY27421.1 DUF2922 domain-containing protein [Romboutsia weinsteinii]
MNVSLKLMMTFRTTAGNKVSLSVDDPRSDLNEQEIKDAMELIITKDIFAPNGATLTEAVEAKVVRTDTTGYDLVIG